MKNKVSPWKSIQFRFLFSVIIATILVVAGLTAFKENRSNHIDEIYAEREIELKDSFSAVSGLESQRLKSLTIENTYWDDMVAFIAMQDNSFEEVVLESQLSSYGADVIWTYDKNYKLVSNTNVLPSKFSSFDLGLSQTDLTNIFKDGFLNHFYKKTDVGFIEVFGATVHPTSDVDHKTAPQGFFFIARILDEDYLKSLESATNFKISLASNPATLESAKPAFKTGVIAFSQDLRDEKGNLNGKLKVRYFSQALVNTYSSLNKLFIGSMLFLAIILTLFYKTLKRIFIDPLAKIYQALLTDDLSEIKTLKSNDSELGRVANLIDTSIRQKNEISENAERMQKAQLSLESRNKEIEKINSLMIDRELKMVELKAEIKQLKSK